MNEPIVIERIFDFQNPLQDPIVVDNRSIKAAPKRNILGIKKRPEYPFYRLFINELKVPDTVTVEDYSRLVYIELNALPKNSKEKTTYRSSDITEFMITESEMPYSIFLDPTQIKDYTDFDKAHARITFQLCSQLTESNPVELAQEFVIELDFKKVNSYADVQFSLHPDFIGPYEYINKARVRLGEISVTSQAERSYAEEIDTCQITARVQNLEGLVYVTDEIREVSESDPSMKGGGLREEGDSARSDLRIESIDGALVLRNLRSNNTIRIPVYADLDKYNNPISERVEDVITTVKYTKRDKPYEEVETKSITILPDSTFTRLLKRITVLDQGLELPEFHYTSGLAVQWIPNEKNASMNCFSLRLGNMAENNEGVVRIKGLRIKFTSANGNIVVLSTSTFPSGNAKESVGGDLNRLFSVKTEIEGEYTTVEELPEILEFPNRPNSYYDFVVSFRHKDIFELPDDGAEIHCAIDFEYQESSGDDQEDSYQTFSSVIQFNLEKNPGRYWMALDFGTSASVAAFDDGSQLQNQRHIDNILLDLQEPLRKSVVEELDSADSYSRAQIEEFGTMFISSKCLLQPNKKFGLVPYSESVVRLSPTVAQAKTYWTNVIPFLKSLIGMEHLPNFDGHFSGFEYKSEDGKKRSFKTAPLEVNKILKIAYYSLLHHFAEQTQHVKENSSEVNKLILTVPNAFSPKHVQLIRKVFEDPSSGLSHFRKNYLTFLCESDAVALQYEMLWNKYNENRPNQDKYRVGDEYVLIYDMGAGTLDLTYIKISRDGMGGKDISVIGRLGKTSAGNYVDFELAQIILDLMQDQLDYTDPDSKFPKIFTNPEPDQMSMAITMKGIIRDKIKPFLGDDSTINLEDEMLEEVSDINNPFQDVIINYEDIVYHDRYKSLLTQNTAEVFDHFFDLYRLVDGNEYIKGEIPLDTVILSGRGVQLHQLREEILANLVDWSSNTDLYCPTGLPEDQLKSAVVQGAMQYALLYRDQRTSSVKISNRNLQARYGLLYVDPVNGRWNFKELLNPSTRPISQEPIQKDGFTIYRYDSDIYDADPGNHNKGNFVNLSATAVAWFVQSFSFRTADDYNNNDTDYITKMVSFDPGALGANRSRVQVRIRITGSNEMEFYFGGGKIDQQNPLRVNLDESPSFRKSMWPYLSVE